MKPALVNAYAAMLPRLEAETTMLERSAIASGTGSLKKDSDTKFVARLMRMMNPPKPARTLDELRSAGVKTVDREGREIR